MSPPLPRRHPHRTHRSQLEIPQLLVADRNFTTVHAEVTKIAGEKTGALGPAQDKISTCNSELEAQKVAAKKKAEDIDAQKQAPEDEL